MPAKALRWRHEKLIRDTLYDDGWLMYDDAPMQVTGAMQQRAAAATQGAAHIAAGGDFCQICRHASALVFRDERDTSPPPFASGRYVSPSGAVLHAHKGGRQQAMRDIR